MHETETLELDYYYGNKSRHSNHAALNNQEHGYNCAAVGTWNKPN